MPKYGYGWQPSRPDIRDLLYRPPPHLMAVELPPAVDLTQPTLAAPFEPPWNQGRLGSCGPNTACEDIVFDLFNQGVAAPPMPCRLYVYYNARQLMGTINSDSGVDNRTMLKALAQWGWCDGTLWPYDTSKFTQQPPHACYDQGATRKIDQYLSVAQDLNTMKACIAAKRPFIFGFTVYESFESQQVAQTGMVPMPSASEASVGGHDVLFVGYDDATQRFKFKNHWGAWGDGGYGYMPYAYATNPQLASDFWTVAYAPYEGNPTPTPPGPVPPGPGPIPPVVSQVTFGIDARGGIVNPIVPGYTTTKQ